MNVKKGQKVIESYNHHFHCYCCDRNREEMQEKQTNKLLLHLNLHLISSTFLEWWKYTYNLTLLNACLKWADAAADCLLLTFDIMQTVESVAETSRQNK